MSEPLLRLYLPAWVVPSHSSCFQAPHGTQLYDDLRRAILASPHQKKKRRRAVNTIFVFELSSLEGLSVEERYVTDSTKDFTQRKVKRYYTYGRLQASSHFRVTSQHLQCAWTEQQMEFERVVR